MNLIESIIALKNECSKKEEKFMEKYGLSPAEYNAIRAIDFSEECTSSSLSDKMKLSYSRGSRVIDKMVEKGYFRLEHSIDDRRKCSIRLTSAGNDLKRKIVKEIDECGKELEKMLSEKEKKDLLKYMNKVTVNLNK